MIIGGSKSQVVENIKKAVESGELNSKVETGDPVLTQEQSDEIVYGYVRNREKTGFGIKSFFARRAANLISSVVNRNTEIIGKEKVSGIKGGAIITCNHFNPLDNTAVRVLVKKTSGKRLYTVAQETNFAMKGFIGFLMNYADIIPISKNVRYLRREFYDMIEGLIKKEKWVLIYPEQEMWFNYRKPRTLKPGAYYYAAKLNVPVISCFVEMRDLPERDNDEFLKVRYAIHVLDPVFPDPGLNWRENSRLMQQIDEKQRKEAYEKIYGEKIDRAFDTSDIAGYTGTTEKTNEGEKS